jgi:hypothetical protein
MAIFEGDARFVKGHMTSSAYPDHLEINPSGSPDLMPVAIEDSRFYPGEVLGSRFSFNND